MKMTKALVAAILALSLMLAAVMPAMAIWGYLYVNKANLNVYEEDNTNSRVLKTVKGGTKLTIDALSPNGKWAQITVKKNKLGFEGKVDFYITGDSTVNAFSVASEDENEPNIVNINSGLFDKLLIVHRSHNHIMIILVTSLAVQTLWAILVRLVTRLLT